MQSFQIVAGQSTDSAFEISDLINQVYAVAEDGMWTVVGEEPAPRTSAKEVQSLLDQGRLLLAKEEETIIGSVCVQLLSPKLAEFGMLVADRAYRGRGLGRQLVLAAEEYGRNNGALHMQLELLTPKSWVHPVKDFLHKWYTRIGYIPIKREPFEQSYAHLSAQLATPCNFTIYHKKL